MQELDWMTRSRREEGGRAHRNKVLVDATIHIAGELTSTASLLAHLDPAYEFDAESIAREAKEVASACIRELRRDGAI